MNDNQITDEQCRNIVHQVIANGCVIYTGPNWVQAFLDAGMNPEYGWIEHLENGKRGAIMGPILHQVAREQQTPS